MEHSGAQRRGNRSAVPGGTAATGSHSPKERAENPVVPCQRGRIHRDSDSNRPQPWGRGLPIRGENARPGREVTTGIRMHARSPGPCATLTARTRPPAGAGTGSTSNSPGAKGTLAVRVYLDPVDGMEFLEVMNVTLSKTPL